MRLTAKFLLAFLITTLVVFSVGGYVRVRGEVAEFDDDMRLDVGAVVASLSHALGPVVDGLGVEAARAVIERADRGAVHLTVRWVGLDDDRQGLAAPVVPRTQLGGLLAGEPVFARIPAAAADPGALVAYAPVESRRVGHTAIEARESLAKRARFVSDSIDRTAYSMLIAFAASAAVALVLGMALIGRPLRAIVRKVRHIATGDLARPLRLRQHDEIGEVASELNAMCDRLARAREDLASEAAARAGALEQLRHADRLATVGRLAAGMAHEIGTPLAVAAGRSAMIVSGEAQGPEAVDNARIVVEQTQRIATIMRALLDFARRSPGRRRRLDLGALAGRTTSLLMPMADKRGVALTMVRATDHALDVDVDALQIEQALSNLVVNAIHATAAGGRVTITVDDVVATPPTAHGGRPGPHACLRVPDTGTGMDAATVEHIFEPFFTTKDIGEGTGLGLPVAHGVVCDHDGWLDVRSVPGEGSCFTIYLPRATEAAA
ncbi:MAG: HAMP domain-containing histidine kinase [Deltaproteobacteria bacterium]|nr:HAMP domain-containing histidine kinase [Deltaproteobacteria bacterium]